MSNDRYETLLRVWSPLALIFGAASAVTWGLFMRVMDPGAPVEVTAVEVLTPQVTAGEEARFLFSVNRNRICSSQIVGFMVEPDNHDHALIRFEPIWGGYGDVGMDTRVLVSRPAPAKPGRYCYRANVTHFCGGTDIYTTTNPQACFEVVP